MYVRAYVAIPCVSANDNVKHTKSNIRYDNNLLTLMAIRINAIRSANHGTRCARRNSRRSDRQGVTHLLDRHDSHICLTDTILSQFKNVPLSTSGSNRY